MNVKLVVVKGKPEGKEIPLRTPKFLIGRGTECHLRPNSELVSRHHCMFIVESGRVSLRELGSTNGTLVNGRRVHGDVSVYHEDLIQVGPLAFQLLTDPVLAPVPEGQAPPVIVALAAATAEADGSGGGPPVAQEQDLEKWLGSVPHEEGAEPELEDENSTVHDAAVIESTCSDGSLPLASELGVQLGDSGREPQSPHGGESRPGPGDQQDGCSEASSNSSASALRRIAERRTDR